MSTMTETGYAKLTATTQHFLDTCPAVISWTADKTATYCSFEFDPQVEVPIVPDGVWFSDAPEHVTDCFVHCECGAATGEACAWTGHVDETVEMEYMPEYLRQSHIAAGNRGRYPANGALRFRAHQDCAALLVDSEDDWAKIIE